MKNSQKTIYPQGRRFLCLENFFQEDHECNYNRKHYNMKFFLKESKMVAVNIEDET